MQNSIQKKEETGRRLFIYLTMFLTAVSLFVYEVLLTRLFSAILSYTMVFLVISFAILGSGIGGMYAYNVLKKKKDLTGSDLIVKSVLLLPVSVAVSVGAIYFLPYIPVFLVYTLIGAVPFVIGGVVVSTIFKANIEGSGKLYFIDLVGSATGSLIIIKLMNRYGFMLSVTMVCILSLFAAVSAGCYYKKFRQATAAGISAIVLAGLFIQGTWITAMEKRFNSYYSNPNKAIEYLKNSDLKPLGISFTKWDALSRTDVIETINRDEKIVVTDGGGEAPILKFDGNLKSVEYLKGDVKYIPFTFGKNDSTLVIGSGGGKDVLAALLGGSKKIDAVEINPSTIAAVNKNKEFSGDIYNRPGVSLYIQDGRNFVEKSKEKYDNIYLSMVMTNSVENNAFSLSENYIFTKEAFKKYFEHLNNNGKLNFMTHNSADTIRITNTGIKVLMDRGVKPENVTDYFVIVNGMDASHASSHGEQIDMPLIMFKNEPFTKEEVNSILATAVQQNKSMIHYPGKEADIYKDIKDKRITFDELLDKIQINVSPIEDKRPFLHNYSKFIPADILIVLLIVLSVWFFIRRRYLIKADYKKASIYFGGLGIAYMLVEIPVVQKMVLYFGSPSLAFSIILFSLLVSSGLGSFLSGLRMVRRFTEKSPVYLLTAAISIVAVQIIMGNVISITGSFPLSMKYIVGFATIFPMGLLMGVPFPTGISRLNSLTDGEEIVPLMWGVNGYFSVIGSVLAVGISMLFGFTVTLYAGAAVYLFLYLVNPLKLRNVVGN